MNKWITNTKTGQSIGVYQGPWRKSAALGLRIGGAVYTLAYFRNEAEVERFNAFIESLPLPEKKEDADASN